MRQSCIPSQDYAIFSGKTLAELMRVVNLAIEKGFVPVGGVAQITVEPGETWLAQAVYRPLNPYGVSARRAEGVSY
jgi:hypothetical protein